MYSTLYVHVNISAYTGNSSYMHVHVHVTATRVYLSFTFHLWGIMRVTLTHLELYMNIVDHMCTLHMNENGSMKGTM